MHKPTEGVAVVEGGISSRVDNVWIRPMTKGCLKRALVAVLAGHNENGVTVAVAHICRDTPMIRRSGG